MAKTNYAKNMATGLIKLNSKGFQMVSTRQIPDFGGGDFSMDCDIVTKARQETSEPHRHAFPQYLCFFSATPDNEAEFDAVVELSLGDEHEVYTIKQPTVVHVPAGLYHGPLNFAKINKPILFIDIGLTGKYTRLEEAKK
jgi:hypothetical protein